MDKDSLFDCFPEYCGELLNIEETGQYNALHNNIYWEINEVAYEIFSLCNGKNSLGNIVVILNETFNIDRNRLENDIISLLFKANLVGLIYFNSNDSFKRLYSYYSNKYVFELCNAQDAFDIMKKDKAGLSINTRLINYRFRDIYSKILSQEEYYFVLKNKSSNLAFIAIEPEIECGLSDKILYISINYIYLNKNLFNQNIFSDFLEWCIFIIFKINKNLSICEKLPFLIFYKKDEDTSILNDLGFQKIGTIESSKYILYEILQKVVQNNSSKFLSFSNDDIERC